MTSIIVLLHMDSDLHSRAKDADFYTGRYYFGKSHIPWQGRDRVKLVSYEKSKSSVTV